VPPKCNDLVKGCVSTDESASMTRAAILYSRSKPTRLQLEPSIARHVQGDPCASAGRRATVRYLRCDRGTEFLNSDLDSFCSAEGITLEPACAYNPQQNGVAERTSRALKEHVRTMLMAAQAKHSLWGEAVKCAAYLWNLCPRAGMSCSPFEAFH
jgi:transposase InsO family protein